LTGVYISVYHRTVTGNEFKRWLASRGCTFEEGTKHTKVYHEGKYTLLPRHGSREVKKGTAEGVKRKLGLK
jgi:mRNA interferase HicA